MMAARRRRRWPGLAWALVAVGCQPQARRALLLDETLTQASELDATAQPWRQAGYHVEYRRFYPHLTWQDLDRYHVVIVLGGRRPSAASDGLDLGDLGLLTEWTMRGGVVVLGYPPEGAGVLDRWVMNRWLAWSGTGITIGDFTLRTPGALPASQRARPVLTAGLRGTGFDPFPIGVNDALLVTDGAQVLARATADAFERAPGLPPHQRAGAAIAAASRVSRGLVVVISRSALGAVGQGDTLTQVVDRPNSAEGTRAFLVALARWTRRPAEWARIPTTGLRATLRLDDGPGTVPTRSPRAAPPAGTQAVPLVRHEAVRVATPVGAPGWIARPGIRALQGDFPALTPGVVATARLAALDSLSSLLDVGAFNLLVTDAHVAALADSTNAPPWQREAARNAWQLVAARLQATSVRWIPLVLPGTLAPTGDSTPAGSCPLDPALWTRIASGVRVLARFAGAHPEVVPAVGIGLDESTRDWGGPPFCDAAWTPSLRELQHDSTLSPERFARLAAVPRAARYDSLLEGGLIAAYDSAVARSVTQRATALRADVRRIRRDLMVAVLLDRSPADWFTTSLVRGFSVPERPVLLFSADPRARLLLGFQDSLNLLHAIRLDPTDLLAGGGPALAVTVFRDQDGFWVGPAESLLVERGDSLARVLRRLAKER
jgi:hypothetical protein